MSSFGFTSLELLIFYKFGSFADESVSVLFFFAMSRGSLSLGL